MMMMERPKSVSGPESPNEDVSNSSTTPLGSTLLTSVNADERVQDLERRLDLLDSGTETPKISPAATDCATAESTAKSAPTSKLLKPGPPAKNNPLLARIKAAQERARLAEQKEKKAKAEAEAEKAALREKLAPEDVGHAPTASQPTDIPPALSFPGINGTCQDGRDMIEHVTPAFPPPPFEAVKLPSSDESRKLQQAQTPEQPQPPSFDVFEQQLTSPPSPSAPSPSAPLMASFDHLQGVLPVAPPPAHEGFSQVPPPSFAELERTTPAVVNNDTTEEAYDDTVFDFDLDGNPLTQDERQAMMDEQRRLYDAIMKEKAANDAAIAQASADAFDSRSSSSAVLALSSSSVAGTRATRTTSVESHTQAVDGAGRASVSSSDGAQQEHRESSRGSRRMVKIGNGQTVALHGQERTKKAIKEGTAILVQCINCQNWMQVTETATLMFCPVCQVVSPVMKQNEVMTKEEAIQLTMDRKLAEKLQAEAYGNEGNLSEGDDGKRGEGYFTKLFSGVNEESTTRPSLSASASSSHSDGGTSWWDKLSSIVSYGVADDSKEKGDLGVTRPPGAAVSSSSSAHRQKNSNTARTFDRVPDPETHGLLRPVLDGNGATFPSGRIAEQKPLFSCVVDSVSSAASAVFSGGTGEDNDGNVHGVDSSSFLAVTSAGRDVSGGGGRYSQLPDDE